MMAGGGSSSGLGILEVTISTLLGFQGLTMETIDHNECGFTGTTEN